MDYHQTDVLLIGAGIMSATLGALLLELEPDIKITILEKLDRPAAESSEAWNNAGTGHSGFCELNYTPQRPDGSVDTTKAVRVAEAFEISKQWWAYLVAHGGIPNPKEFIRPIPHEALVWGQDAVSFLRARYQAMVQHPLFEGMRYTEDRATLSEWMPLVMAGRDASTPLAATRMDIGTDVNFGQLTRILLNKISASPNCNIHYSTAVHDLEQLRLGEGPDLQPEHRLYSAPGIAAGPEGRRVWHIRARDVATHQRTTFDASFVFIGAGGGALPLLQASGIPEGRHYGGFPVSGQWLRCTNKMVIQQHHAKVYGKAAVGAPPMSVPHLDTRVIDGEQALLFGPYAGFSTKFLKEGSLMDLPKSVTVRNLGPMIMAGLHNFPLTKYLIRQVMQSDEDRLEALRQFVPTAKEADWELAVAGQRVQVIKKDEEEGGILEFGTEVVAAQDGTLAALLGASPGASTAMSIMLGLLEECFPERLATNAWQDKIRKMIPGYGLQLDQNPALLHKLRRISHAALGLPDESDGAAA